VKGHLFVTPGDITQFHAHAVAYSASSYLGCDGNLYSAFAANIPGFMAWYEELRNRPDVHAEVGDSYWMPLAKDRQPHGVVVTVSTGRGSMEADRAAVAVRAALTTAIDALRQAGVAGRLLIALPAFRVGLGGDRSRRLRSALVQITAAFEVLEQAPDVDAVFVTYTPTLYRIFLEARRQVLGQAPALTAARYQALEEALRAGECVLFIGAGLSRGAGLPDWSELVARLAKDLGIEPHRRLDYLDLAQWYLERFGRDALSGLVRDTYCDPAALPTLAHYLLMSLPVRYVITTNYDDLLERALTAVKRYPVKVVQQEDVALTGQGGGVFVVKLHGDVTHPEHIILSRDDFDEFFERRPAMALLLEGLLLNQTFFFIGYGLRDPNFRQIYSRIARMLRNAPRRAFATTFEASGDSGKYLRRQWKQQHMELLAIEGATAADQEQEFVRFLDRLADEVALQSPRLFLAPDVEPPPALAELRNLLVDHVGAAMETAARRDLHVEAEWPQVRYLADVLGFMANQGWRPNPRHGGNLCQLWEHLAAHAPDHLERRRLLIAALAAAEAFDDVQRIHRQLEEAEKKE
jgi:O-acetyl-ADP-ribose deacetylase (regulator of RNase III)